MTRTLLAFAVGSWLLAPVAHAQRENDPERCANGVDDDGDLLVDCDDSGCRRLTVCTGERAPERGEAACHNGADDDGDGMVDCADDGCAELCGAAHLGARPAPDQESVRFFDDEPEEEPGRVFAMGWAERPMTYHEGMLVPQLGSLFEDASGS